MLTIKSDTAITISGSTTTDTIVVEKNKDTNITLAGVDINVSGTDDACAFKIADDSTGNVTITLADDSVNTLKIGDRCAGIGGGDNGSASDIVITGGSVNASSIGANPTLADGTTRVFLYKIDTDDVSSVTIDGVAYPTTHNGEAKIYPYLTEGFHTVVKDRSTTEVI